jgi:hypothetical protein
LLPAGIAGLVLLGLAFAWKAWQNRAADQIETPPPTADLRDPRLTYKTPFQNVRPEVKYVGDSACAGCHREYPSRFHQHPMGRSLATIAAAAPIEKYDPAAFNPFVADNPFVASGLHYRVRRQGKRVVHEEWAEGAKGNVLAKTEAEVAFVIGSGQRGRAYLVNHDGYLFQSPITWYPQAGRWDLAPGYEGGRNKHFSRPIAVGCLFCHCDQADPVPGTTNRYRTPVVLHSIGCERCHGPGELHVAARKRGDDPGAVDPTIVNPRHLEPALREAVCQQCHLSGVERILARGRSFFDYRPGLPLHLFLMDFVERDTTPAASRFLGTVEQMTASRCYRASRGPKQLGCISCHDPHQRPPTDQKVAYFRSRCLACHTESSCTLPATARRQKNKEDSCIACHMPRSGSEVVHTSVSDHRIPRRPDRPAKTPPAKRPPPSPEGLVPLQRELLDAGDEGAARNLGVALALLLQEGPPPPVARQFADKALPLLDAALKQADNDPVAWEAKGDTLCVLGRPDEALAAYERALSAQPEAEAVLYAAGKLTLDLNRPATSRSYLERAIRVDPWSWQTHYLLAAAWYESGEPEQAVRQCRESLRLEPFNSTSRRKLLVECYLRLGQKEQAQIEFDRLFQLSPQARRAELRRWYEKQMP